MTNQFKSVETESPAPVDLKLVVMGRHKSALATWVVSKVIGVVGANDAQYLYLFGHIYGTWSAARTQLKDATPAGVLLGSGKLATELDRLDLIIAT